MATLMLDDAIYDRLRAQAEANSHMLEEEVRAMIDQRSRQSRADWAGRMKRLREEIRAEHGDFPDSVTLIRQFATKSDRSRRERRCQMVFARGRQRRRPEARLRVAGRHAKFQSRAAPRYRVELLG